MKLNLRKIDASLLCFALVVVAAIPVAALRSKTYSVGYELGRLKSEEKQLRQRNVELQSQLATVQRNIRESRLRAAGEPNQLLNLPQKSNVLRSRSAAAGSENSARD